MVDNGDRPIRVRWDGGCASCGSVVPARAHGWWDPKAMTLTCLTCRPDPSASAPAAPGRPVATVDPAQKLPAPPEQETAPTQEAIGSAAVTPPPDVDASPDLVDPFPVPLTAEERGTAGASARAQGQRRSQKREARVRAKHPRIGGFLLAVSDDPTTTKVWAQGAVGEERIGAFLEESRSKGIEVLHDRQVPGSKANLDHLVVAPTGIWIVDPKRYLSGRLEMRDVGGWRKTDRRLFVGGRDKTKLVETMNWQLSVVRAAIAGTPHETVPVRGALCFVDTELPMFAKPFTIDGVIVTWRKHLLTPLLTVDAGVTPISDLDRATLARYLAEHFNPHRT